MTPTDQSRTVAEVAAKLRPHEKLALDFLEREGQHHFDTIEDENAMAAALCFSDMGREGLVVFKFGIVSLTPLGLAVRNHLEQSS